MYSVRDPIHKTINFSEEEKRLIDHPFVQRLRYIRQLGTSSLVYPGATHDRFSHALGAMHVVGRLWSRIVSSSAEIFRSHFSEDDLVYFGRILRAAALLHDLGHPPFSHAAEVFMPQLDQLEIPQEWWIGGCPVRQAKHEEYSVLLIADLGKERGIFSGPDEAQDIASLVHHDISPSLRWQQQFGQRVRIHTFLSNLISGELDCDRMDYLLRDTHNTGVSYGNYDIDHLIESVGVTEQNGGLVLTLDANAVRAFEDFLLARYHMFLQVYLHKTTVGFNYILEQSLMHKEWELVMPTDAWGYSKLHDSFILEKLFTASGNPQHIWARRLVYRQPLKILMNATHAVRHEKELLDTVRHMLDEASIPYHSVTAHQYLSRLVPYSEQSKSASLLVRRKGLGTIAYEPIEHYSTLLQKYNEVIAQTTLYVFPEEYERAVQCVQNYATP